MLTLYFAPGTSSMAPHIALHEIGVPFEARAMGPGATREPAYRALNPEGKVPTLTVDGRPMTEVAAILFYLARRFPESGLLPEDDVEAQAQAISWMSFLASTVHPARRQGLEHARGIYALADARLAAGPWAVGSSYSIADIHLFRLFWRFSGSLNPTRAEFPHLFDHYDRILDRPAVRRTIEIENEIGYRLPA
jgi:glutathione S-transferase